MKEITIEDVKNFLNSMNVKIDIYGMVFAERQRCQEFVCRSISLITQFNINSNERSYFKSF